MSDHAYLSFVLALSLFLALTVPASAQRITVQNGATITVQNGAFWDLNGATVDLGGTSSTASISETSDGRFSNGPLAATRSLDSPSEADPGGLGLEISASENLGDVEVTRVHTAQTANNNASIERYYDVTASRNNSGLDAELTFAYNDAERNGIQESELEFFKSEDEGTSWSEEGSDSRDVSANTVTLGGIESLSRWTLGSESEPLPVELAAFEGAETDRGVELTWQTAMETNNAGFEIQRRVEDANAPEARKRTGASGEGTWEKIGFVDGIGTTSEARTYEFTDADLPYAADEISYRLRQVDVDGTGSVSEPILIERTVDEVELLGTHPNPARSRATVRFAVPETREVTLQLYDLMGRQVRTLSQGPKKGRTEMRVGLSDLSSGIYFLRLQAGGTTKTQKMTVVR